MSGWALEECVAEDAEFKRIEKMNELPDAPRVTAPTTEELAYERSGNRKDRLNLMRNLAVEEELKVDNNQRKKWQEERSEERVCSTYATDGFTRFQSSTEITRYDSRLLNLGVLNPSCLPDTASLIQSSRTNWYPKANADERLSLNHEKIVSETWRQKREEELSKLEPHEREKLDYLEKNRKRLEANSEGGTVKYNGAEFRFDGENWWPVKDARKQTSHPVKTETTSIFWNPRQRKEETLSGSDKRKVKENQWSAAEVVRTWDIDEELSDTMIALRKKAIHAVIIMTNQLGVLGTAIGVAKVKGVIRKDGKFSQVSFEDAHTLPRHDVLMIEVSWYPMLDPMEEDPWNTFQCVVDKDWDEGKLLVSCQADRDDINKTVIYVIDIKDEHGQKEEIEKFQLHIEKQRKPFVEKDEIGNPIKVLK